MSKSGFLEALKPTDCRRGGEVKFVWADEETTLPCSVSAKQVPSSASTLAARLRAHLSSLTALEASTLFTLVHRRANGGDTLLKCAAADAGVSEALIVKIAKKLGFEGFRQLREALDEHGRLAQTDLQAELCIPEGTCVRLQMVLRACMRSLEQGLARVSSEALERAADWLLAARQRDLYGQGGSGQVARDAAQQFLRMGVRASVFDDGELMLMSAGLLRRGDVVMAFSHSGQTAAVLEAARQARRNGAQLIALTNRSDSPLGRESDVALCTNLNSLPWVGDNAAARLAQLGVLDALLSAVNQKGCFAARANLSHTSAA